MTYCSRDDVKQRLGIPLDDASVDAEIDAVISEAKAFIDAKLTGELGQIPFDESNVPDIIRYACADLAAAFFRARRSPDKRDVFWEMVLEKLDAYIDQTRWVVKV